MCGKDTVLQTKQTGFRLRGLLLASQPSEAGSRQHLQQLQQGQQQQQHLLFLFIIYPKDKINTFTFMLCMLFSQWVLLLAAAHCNGSHFVRHFWSHMRCMAKTSHLAVSSSVQQQQQQQQLKKAKTNCCVNAFQCKSMQTLNPLPLALPTLSVFLPLTSAKS